MTTDTILEDDRWVELGLEALAELAGAGVFRFFDLDNDAFEVCVMGCSDLRISELNTEFREKPGATNVLSWPSEERAAAEPGGMPQLPSDQGDPELGDIAIAYETCVKEAHAGGKPIDQHVTHLLVHGVLHLLGYDHIHDLDAALMERTEAEILALLGHPDPYSV
jgi:probable rRNA maturation factor